MARMHPRRLTCRPLAALLAATLCVSLPGTASAFHPIAFGVVKLFGIVAGGAKLTDYQAYRTYERAKREGTCAERREALVKILPEAQRLAGLSRDVYQEGADLAAAGLKEKDLGNGLTAYFEPDGQRYAEVRVDEVRHEVDIVFRGTRLGVRSDLSTDVLNFVGLETAYYRWAAALTARVLREHPGLRVKATGHSLGGGLVLYSVLKNPGVEGVVFNPAGLSWVTWLTTSRENRARVNAAITVVATRSAAHIEPLSAISLAHRSVLPGHVFFVETEPGGPLTLHSITTVTAVLDRLTSNEAAGIACDGVLGVIAH
jgi:hypothetical protein